MSCKNYPPQIYNLRIREMHQSNKPKLALILGSGFSKEHGLPLSSEISTSFLNFDGLVHAINELDTAISTILEKFWSDIFGYSQGPALPTMEDHFTVLDLAANSGHQLGKDYPPKKLRAIRRMSIHRVFSILDRHCGPKDSIIKLITELSNRFELAILSLNWDVVVESYLVDLLGEESFQYPIFGEFPYGLPFPKNGIPLLKMHGSANWQYCDACRRITGNMTEKTALRSKSFLESEDFELFGFPDIIISDNPKTCGHCRNRLTGRIATFSYRKSFLISQFHTIWDEAHRILSEADKWLFIGYSLPEADFEFKHLLKSAQHARKHPKNWSAEVIIKNDERAAKRYIRLFGIGRIQIKQKGLGKWVEEEINGDGDIPL